MKFAGGAFFLIGILVLTHPAITELAAEIIYGGALLFGGLTYFLATFFANAGRALGHLALSVVLMGAGAILCFSPESGTRVVTNVLGVAFAAQFVIQLIIFFSGALGGGRYWMLASALYALIASGLMMVEPPTYANWMTGAVIGLNLLVLGLAMIAMPKHLNRQAAPLFNPGDQ